MYHRKFFFFLLVHDNGFVLTLRYIHGVTEMDNIQGAGTQSFACAKMNLDERFALTLSTSAMVMGRTS